MDEQKTNGLIGEFIKLIASLASVLAVLSAVLSVLGFIILRSNANLLGLSIFLHHSIGDYLYEGGAFLVYTLFEGLRSLISMGLFWWLAILIAITLYVILSKNEAAVDKIRTIGNRTRLTGLTQQPWFRWICTLAVLYLLYHCVSHLLPPSGTEDLLFRDNVNPEVARRATQESRDQLELEYDSLVRYVIVSGVAVFFLAWIQRATHTDTTRAKASQKRGGETVSLFLRIGRFLVYGLLLVELILIAVGYAIYIYPNEFHKVCLNLSDEGEKGIIQSDNAWLIKEDQDAFVIYFGDTKQIYVLKKEHVVNIAITERENIFAYSDPKHDEERCRRNQ